MEEKGFLRVPIQVDFFGVFGGGKTQRGSEAGKEENFVQEEESSLRLRKRKRNGREGVGEEGKSHQQTEGFNQTGTGESALG